VNFIDNSVRSWGGNSFGQLAIRAEGLGTSLTMQLNNEETDVKRLLDISDGFALAAHLGVGWPAQPHPTRLQRRQVEDFTYVDRFGGEPLRITDADRRSR
jgi:hypothetical protein